MTKYVEPSLGAEAFSCPHCGAIAHQTWLKVYAKDYAGDERPFIAHGSDIAAMEGSQSYDGEHEEAIRWLTKSNSKLPFIHEPPASVYADIEIGNIPLSCCFSCKRLSIWVGDQIVYPGVRTEIPANDDLPTEIKADFQEAASIVDQSPRGAAALLRLCIQKLLKHLGEKGSNINADIGALVQKGLHVRTQKALDIVRVIGNEAVHPGQLDLRDDKATAVKLFGLVNLIADQMITQPKHLDAMFEDLPHDTKQAIQKRDTSRS